jgi:hypothetical protein
LLNEKKYMGGKQGLTCANGKCGYLLQGAADRIKFPGGGDGSGEFAHRKPKPNEISVYVELFSKAPVHL